MTPLILVTIGVILVFTPLSVVGSWFLLGLYRQDRTPLNLVLAVMSITRTVAAVLVVIPTVAFIAGVPAPWGGQLILVSLDILLITNVVVAGYLWRLR